MPKANSWFDGKANAWVFTGKGGAVAARIGGGGIETGDGGTGIKKIGKLSGTLLPLAAVGTALSAISTVSNMTGLAIGDVVIFNVKQAIGGNLNIGAAFIPTTNTLNVYITNTQTTTAGSLVAKGVDVIYYRT